MTKEGVEELDEEIARLQAERTKKDKGLVSFGGTGEFDEDLYGGGDRSQYRASIAINEEDQEEEEYEEQRTKLRTFTAPTQLLNEPVRDDVDDDVFNQKNQVHRQSRG